MIYSLSPKPTLHQCDFLLTHIPFSLFPNSSPTVFLSLSLPIALQIGAHQSFTGASAMENRLDMSLDDLIKMNKSSSGRGGGGGGRGRGRSGPGPARRFANRAANRATPYSAPMAKVRILDLGFTFSPRFYMVNLFVLALIWLISMIIRLQIPFGSTICSQVK